MAKQLLANIRVWADSSQGTLHLVAIAICWYRTTSSSPGAAKAKDSHDYPQALQRISRTRASALVQTARYEVLIHRIRALAILHSSGSSNWPAG